MSVIKPFNAVYYNKEVVGDFTKVVAPPYDVIGDELLSELQTQSPHNFTYIDLNKENESDNEKDNRYTRSSKIFQEWLKENVLTQDEKLGVYFYKQDYKVMGERHTRLGFISLMQLHNEDDSKVKPHEKTHAHAVEDRFELTKALASNLSPIFVCYSDKQKKVEKIFTNHVMSTDPLIDVTDADDVHHRMWKLNDPDLINDINESVGEENLFIADGHHRYKVACDYRQLRQEAEKSNNADASYNYVMTYFTNIDSKDLKIFPMHRIVKKIPKKLDFLEDYFRIDKVKDKDDLLILLAKAGRNEHAFGMYTKDGIRLLRLKTKTLIAKHIKEGSEDYKQLDATILKNFVFDKLGIEPADIIYTKDFNETIDMVDHGQADASFIMNAVKIPQLKAIALNGERMPPKTTYFYPKVLSGLTVYKMD